MVISSWVGGMVFIGYYLVVYFIFDNDLIIDL